MIEMGKIYLFCVPLSSGDVLGYALAENGIFLAEHTSSNETFSKHDMGFTSNWKHGYYEKHYPEGFTLEWVDDAKNNQGWRGAMALNMELAQG